MPHLDVTEILSCPDLADRFDVRRRTETVNDFGESIKGSEVLRNKIGVITSAGANDLQRLPEDQRMGRIMSLITRFPLRGPAPGFQPDEILWTGSTYVVVWVDPYTRYGRGFVQTLICSKDSVDPAPVSP